MKTLPKMRMLIPAFHSPPLLLLLPGPDTHPRPLSQALLKAHQNAFGLGQSLLQLPGPCLGSGLLFHGPQLARGSLLST